jgi:hypothetical protein
VFFLKLHIPESHRPALIAPPRGKPMQKKQLGKLLLVCFVGYGGFKSDSPFGVVYQVVWDRLTKMIFGLRSAGRRDGSRDGGGVVVFGRRQQPPPNLGAVRHVF